MIEELSSFVDFEDAIDNALAVVGFTASWCGRSQTIAPHFEEMNDVYPSVKFAKVDVDKQSEIAETQGITAVPTFKLYSYGECICTVKGADKDALQSKIEELKVYAICQHHTGFPYKVSEGDAAMTACQFNIIWSCCGKERSSRGCHEGPWRHHPNPNLMEPFRVIEIGTEDNWGYSVVPELSLIDFKYSCCHESAYSPGCQVGKHPIAEARFEEIKMERSAKLKCEQVERAEKAKADSDTVKKKRFDEQNFWLIFWVSVLCICLYFFIPSS
jgi:thioredoxin 1